MIEEFISRSLILALGYAYPAFLCFKTIEKNRVAIQELRFWCQYWTIVAVLTVLEKFSDIFISWLPMYRGMKLALFIYLWHPNTKVKSKFLFFSLKFDDFLSSFTLKRSFFRPCPSLRSSSGLSHHFMSSIFSSLSSLVLYTYNLGASYLCVNLVVHSGMKHLAIDYHFVRDLVKTSALRIVHVSSADQLADVLTKSLTRPKLLDLCTKISRLGSDYVYETLLRRYLLRYETDIDRSLFEAKERALNLAIYYWHDCTKLGSKWVLQFFQFVVSQSASIRLSSSPQNAKNQQSNVAPPPPTPPSTPSGIFKRNIWDKRRPPVPPPGPSTPHLSQTPKSESMKVRLHSQTQFIHPQDILIRDHDIDSGLEEKSDGEHADGDKIKSHQQN